MPIEPAIKKSSPGKQKAGAIAVGLTAMALIAAPFIGQWEGKRNYPYLDAVGVKTVCYGETHNVQDRRYSDDECAKMLQGQVERFGKAVASASPGIEQYPYQWAAHTSLAYNIGIGAYKNSSVSRLFREGDYIGACRFMTRYKYAGGRVLMGLAYRREGDKKRIGEYQLCLVDAVPVQLEEARA